MIYVSTGGRRDVAADVTAAEYLANGIAAVELSGGLSRPDLCEALEALKRSAPEASFQVHNYFPPPQVPFVLNLASLDPQVMKLSRAHVERAVRLGRALGCPRYSFHAGFLVDPKVSELGQRIRQRALYPRAQALDLFIDTVRSLAAWAESEGAQLLIENNVLSARNLAEFGENPLLMVEQAEILTVLREMPRNVGLLLDVAHLKVSAATLGFDAAAVLRDLTPWIRAYHLSDNDGTADSNEPVRADSWFWPFLRSDLNYYSLEVYGVSNTELREQQRLAQRKLALAQDAGEAQ